MMGGKGISSSKKRKPNGLVGILSGSVSMTTVLQDL